MLEPFSKTDRGFAFVVVTYNSRKVVSDCLESIIDQKLGPSQIIVVDNDSSDGTAEFVESDFGQVTLVRNGRNVGYGAANNIGVAHSTENLIAIVNPDVQLDPDWCQQIYQAMRDHPRCGAAEGKLLLSYQPGILNSRGSYVNLLGFGCPTGFGEDDFRELDPKRVSYPSGAAFVIRREAFGQIEGFDETYFLYHDDVDMGLRLHSAGWIVMYVPLARANHDFRSGLNSRKIRLLEENRWKTLLKNMPTEYFLKCAPLLLASELGLLAYLSLADLGRSKLQATAGFLRHLPRLLALRRSHRLSGKVWVNPRQTMTDAFPALLPNSGWASSVARKLQSRYYRAFFGSPAQA